jgi:hypothetical protein
MHSQRLARNGSLDPRQTQAHDVPAIDKIRRYIDDSGGPSACHPWTRGLSGGYAKANLDGKYQLVNRWLLGRLRGEPLGPKELACHHCDNPPCCNPAHLYVGTQADNMADMARRGRAWNPLAAAKRAQTHCIRGHEFTSANTHIDENGHRSCRTCNREKSARLYAVRRAARAS